MSFEIKDHARAGGVNLDICEKNRDHLKSVVLLYSSAKERRLHSVSAMVKKDSLQYYGFIFAIIMLAWWVFGMVYTLGHTLFTSFLPYSVYNVLSYPIAGPFLLISETLLSGHTHLPFHLLLVLFLGFAAGIVFGLIKKLPKVL